MRSRAWNIQRVVGDEEGHIFEVEGGDEEAAVVAGGLAAVANADFLRSVLDLKTAIDRLGGEGFIGSYRIKLFTTGPNEGKRIPPDLVATTEGRWVNGGYYFCWRPIAKVTREATQAPIEAEEGEALTDHLPLMPEEEFEAGSAEEPEPELAKAG